MYIQKVICAIALVFMTINRSEAQEFQVNITDFVQDVMIHSKTDERIKMVWWLPTIYWKISNQGNSFVTEKMIKELEDAVEDYNIIAALDGKAGPFGIDYNDDLTVVLVDDNGTRYEELPKEDISSETQHILSLLKPILAKMIGEMGENLQFYVFPLFEENIKIDPYKEGEVTVLVNDELFKYQLPLGSLLNKKKCTVDDELYTGSWKYCPFHGKELVEN